MSYYGEGALIDPTTPEKFAELAEQQAQQTLDFVVQLCDAAGVQVDKLSLTSDIPYQAIIDAATQAGCDLIFMASHGRRGFTALLLGSETNKVLTHSKIPVLVYRCFPRRGPRARPDDSPVRPLVAPVVRPRPAASGQAGYCALYSRRCRVRRHSVLAVLRYPSFRRNAVDRC